jgi:hypothetical protein
MDLLINYGTTASAGGQPVIAEIELTQASTSQYQFTFNEIGRTGPTGTNSETAWSSTNYIEILDDNLILSNNFWHQVNVWDSNNEYIGNYWNANTTCYTTSLGTISNNNINFPSNAAYFVVERYASTVACYNTAISYSNFSSLTLSYPISAGATTTFYDSYPDGNVIGTTAGTEVAGGLTNYSLTFNQNNLNGTSNNDWSSTTIIPIINNSIIINNTNTMSQIAYFDSNNTYINGVTFQNSPPYVGDFSNIPTNATHFNINIRNNNPTWTNNVSFATFSTSVVSFQEPGYLQIDPPTGKRIKQIALKGL